MTDPISNLLLPHIASMAPYTPIEPFEVLSARLGRSPERIVKLDANENPYGPHPAVREALAAYPFPHIYPDPEQRTLPRPWPSISACLRRTSSPATALTS